MGSRFRGTYAEGFAPRDFAPAHPELWNGCALSLSPGLGPTGPICRDWSGAKNDGTLTNLTLSAAWAASGGRYSIKGNGTTGFVGLNAISLAGEKFVSFWINFNSNPGGVVFGEFVAHYYPYIDATDIYLNDGTANFSHISHGGLILGIWHHILISGDGTVATVYLNGKKLGTITDNLPTAMIAFLGYGNGTGPQSDASFDDFMVCKRTATATDVALLASRRGIAYEYERPARLMTYLKASGSTPVSQTYNIPVEWLASLQQGSTLPVEFIGSIAASTALPAEWLATSSAALVIPAEWTASIQQMATLAAEWLASLSQGSTIPAEWLATMAALNIIPVEWTGVAANPDAVWMLDARGTVWLLSARGTVWKVGT